MACWLIRFYSRSFLLLLMICFLMKSSTGERDSEQESEEINKSALNDWRGRAVRRAATGGMWFGPRLGKRSNLGYDQKSQDDGYSNLESTLLDAADQEGNAILEFIDTPGRITFSGGKRRFTPRLGRELQLMSDEEDNSPMSRPRTINFIPRLGRDLSDIENQPREHSEETLKRLYHILSQTPYTRSLTADQANGVHLVENPGRPPFAPRLGRKMPPWWEYTPRPGRDLLGNIDDTFTNQKNRIARSAKKPTEHVSTS